MLIKKLKYLQKNYVNLTYVNLTYVNLIYVNLTYVNLIYVYLTYVNQNIKVHIKKSSHISREPVNLGSHITHAPKI
jgi:hypothetical protein